ncbi:hypothetical protein DFQ26_001963 [Actinomortierella ambigua]|nr:hypothetical protein DFQ26_001963 [Actinomortierella ambigua]
MSANIEDTYDLSKQPPQVSTGHLAPSAHGGSSTSLRSPLTPPPTPIIPDNTPCGQNSEELTVSARQLQRHQLVPEFLTEYTLGDELGSGGFGFVVSATRNADGEEVAVKFIFRDKVPVHGWAKDPELGVIPIEIYVLRNVSHPNIIRYINMYQDYKYFYLIMELHGTPWSASNPLLNKNNNNNGGNTSMIEAMAKATLSQRNININNSNNGSGSSSLSSSGESSTSGYPKSSSSSSLSSAADSDSGIAVEPPKPALLVRRTSCDLFECIEHHSKFSEAQARVIFKQIVECVDYLNSRGICHRDIKDENIVIDNDFVVKLIDFGSAVIIPKPQGKLFDRFYGTINYASPEILRGEKYRAEAAEIWSLGILLYTILYGEVPFNDPMQAIRGPYIPPRVRSSMECLHLLNWMLAKSPDQRATIEDVVKHPWIAGISMT